MQTIHNTKKLILFIIYIISLILVLFTGCTVNEYTSILRITNKSNDDAENIKIGDTLIAYRVATGATYYYYIFKDITGQLTANNLTSAGYTDRYNVNRNSVVEKSGTYTLKAGNYFFDSDIFSQDEEDYITLRCEKHAYDWQNDEYDEYPDEGFYEE